MSVRDRLCCVVLALVAAVVVACAPAPEAAAPAGGGAFPVTVAHAFGETVVPAEPQRVVSVGLTEQDVLLALDVVPVGVTFWYAEQPSATWPWARDRLGGATPEVLRAVDGFDYEAIAELAPDLIVGTNAGIEQDTYDRLSAIAPTIAHAAGVPAYFSAWDQQTALVGAALGRPDEAAALVAGVREEFAQAAAAHPEFAGTTAVFLQAPYYEGAAVAYPDGLSTAFLTDLGFVVPDAIDAFAPPDVSAQANIPLEQLGVLDAAEVLVWATEDDSARTELEAQQVYRQLAAVRGGHLAFTDEVLAAAIYFSTPLSLPYVLDELVPRLERAVAGNPETVPAP